MGAFRGAQTDQLRDLGSSVTTAAGRITELFDALDGIVLVEQNWQGSDAESFRAAYTADVRGTAHTALVALRARSSTLVEEAEQQDAASSAAIGTAVSSMPATPTGAPAGGMAAPAGPVASASLGFWDTRGDERSGRRGEGRENTPRREGDEDYDPDADNPNAQYSTPGPDATAPGDTGLGDGVPGTDADAPEPPAWTPPADGATGPVTYPLSTAWDGHTANGDWFYASGSFNYNLTGTVTAYPPDADHPEWRYEVDTQVNFRDRYNWDGGIAQEYNLVGDSSPQRSEGTVP
ncbi:hypothetical protein ACT3SP_14235 [Brachybacterium sp. AOP43-C2-M15]|uniref:hypothetical protein n=1 Tax=Brachybacterium sp. AOP43-C2-M15 TaxID=3457661 RepID=UPI004034E886